MEDVSTLGVEWGESESLTQGTAEQSALLEAQADEEEKYFEKNALVVDGYRCPNEYIHVITPMEFEEMVNLFTKFDTNKNGTIDVHEAKKILHYLELDFSIEKAEELMKLIDTDGSGEIDFAEFCKFIVLMKRGDERVKGFSHLLDKINSTPLGELERQAKFRELKIEFEVIEEREATIYNPTIFVVELRLSGIWYKFEDGEIKSEYGIRKFQGMANTTREAKYAAATTAIVNLGDAMPGLRYKPGEFPEEWLQWVDDNLLRGVDPGKVVSILASKGFHPHKNVRLMHRILAWQSLLLFTASHPEIDAFDDSEKLNEELVDWIKDTVAKGVDGEVLYQLLKDKYIDLEKENIHFAQQLRNNELGSLKGKNESRACILDFWHACKMGYLEDVIMYCKCGVAVNEEVLDQVTCERTRALSYAASNGHAEVVRILLKNHADVKYVDRRGRNAVHLAAMRGHAKVCQVLIEYGGHMFAGDMHGNTPLHLAALNNHYDVVDFLAAKGQELARNITSDKVRPRKDSTFLDLVKEVYNLMPTKKLGPAETVRFEKTWLHESAVLLVQQLDPDVRYMLPRSCEEIMQDVLARFDPRRETGVFVTNDLTGEQIFVKTVANPADLTILLNYTYRQAAIDSINRFRRTALHMACDANIVNSHEKIIYRLVDFYGCNVLLRDMHTRRAIDVLVMDKIVRDRPSATESREKLLIARRENELKTIFSNFDEEDRLRTEERRQKILDDCIVRGITLDERVWHCLRTGSIFKKRFGHGWEMYEDPDTGRILYLYV
jgi:ankyrin repeat protein